MKNQKTQFKIPLWGVGSLGNREGVEAFKAHHLELKESRLLKRAFCAICCTGASAFHVGDVRLLAKKGHESPVPLCVGALEQSFNHRDLNSVSVLVKILK